MNAVNPNDGRGSMSDIERTMERVRKLLAIAEDERADSNEAAAAASMADKIMRKYQIEHADIVERELKRGDAFDDHYSSSEMKRDLRGKEGSYKTKKNASWAQWLHVAIAQLHDCQSRQAIRPEFGYCLRFSGYRADVQVAAWTFDYLANAMIASTRRWQKEASKRGEPRTKVESNSYRDGFVTQLTGALRKMKAEKDAEMQQASASRSLVLVKTQLVAEKFGQATYLTKTSTARRVGDAFYAGREAGKQVNVGARGIGSDAAPARRLK